MTAAQDIHTMQNDPDTALNQVCQLPKTLHLTPGYVVYTCGELEGGNTQAPLSVMRIIGVFETDEMAKTAAKEELSNYATLFISPIGEWLMCPPRISDTQSSIKNAMSEELRQRATIMNSLKLAS